MDANRFDAISKLFAARRSRRQTMKHAAVGFGTGVMAAVGLGDAAAAQEATPVAASPTDRNTETLFLQGFQSGSIAPDPNIDGRYTVMLEHGLGQTVYFSDRPERIVGTTPTAEFLASIGLSDTDPPNAALVVERDNGETEIAVIELLHSSYDEATHSATYEVAVLKEWERELGLGMTKTPSNLADFGATFGAAHLFIDDCADGLVFCNAPSANESPIQVSAGFCYVNGCCQPCTDGSSIEDYWAAQCYAQYPGACLNCEGGCVDDGTNNCTVAGWSTWLIPCAD